MIGNLRTGLRIHPHELLHQRQLKQRRIRLDDRPQRQVDGAFALQVHHLVGRLHPHMHIRVAPVEIPQSRDQPQAGEGRGGGQGQGLGVRRRGQGLHAGQQFAQGAMHLVLQLLARVGQAYALAGAFEQQHAIGLFEGFDLVRHSGGCHRQFIGRRLETTQAGSGFEGAQGGQGQSGKHVGSRSGAGTP